MTIIEKNMDSDSWTDWESEITVAKPCDKVDSFDKTKIAHGFIFSLQTLGKTWEVKFQVLLPHSNIL